MWPKIWGSMAWDTLYFMILSYPPKPTPEQQENMQNFWKLFCTHLPCPVCVYHSLIYMERKPVDTSSRLALEKYFIDFRNEVNTRLKKPIFSLEKSRESLYTRRIAQHLEEEASVGDPEIKSTGTNKNTLVIILVVFLVLSVLTNTVLIILRNVHPA
jgi:hypothetical protein